MSVYIFSGSRARWESVLVFYTEQEQGLIFVTGLAWPMAKLLPGPELYKIDYTLHKL